MEDRRSMKLDFLKSELDVANAQNERLAEENAILRHKLHRLTNEDRSNSTVNVEAKLRAFQFEDERDRLYEKLEKIKRKYNQLHEAYLQKVKRCKAFEDVFSRQKTLNGLVMKSAIDQRQQEQDVMTEKRRSENMQKSSIENLQAHVTTLQAALDEAHDIIDELEFELESVDFLEMENQRLQNELKTLKKDKLKLRRVINRSHVEEPEEKETVEMEEGEEKEDDEEKGEEDTEEKEEEDIEEKEEDTEELPEYRELDGVVRFQTDSNASSLADSFVGDMDPETLERSALTESLIQNAEAESNCLRRELLRSRLQLTIRPAFRPTSSDA